MKWLNNTRLLSIVSLFFFLCSLFSPALICVAYQGGWGLDCLSLWRLMKMGFGEVNVRFTGGSLLHMSLLAVLMVVAILLPTLLGAFRPTVRKFSMLAVMGTIVALVSGLFSFAAFLSPYSQFNDSRVLADKGIYFLVVAVILEAVAGISARRPLTPSKAKR